MIQDQIKPLPNIYDNDKQADILILDDKSEITTPSPSNGSQPKKQKTSDSQLIEMRRIEHELRLSQMKEEHSLRISQMKEEHMIKMQILRRADQNIEPVMNTSAIASANVIPSQKNCDLLNSVENLNTFDFFNMP